MIQTIVENVGLTLFAEMGLVLFVIVFIAVVLNAVRRPRSEIEQLSQMALEEDELELLLELEELLDKLDEDDELLDDELRELLLELEELLDEDELKLDEDELELRELLLLELLDEEED